MNCTNPRDAERPMESSPTPTDSCPTTPSTDGTPEPSSPTTTSGAPSSDGPTPEDWVDLARAIREAEDERDERRRVVHADDFEDLDEDEDDLRIELAQKVLDSLSGIADAVHAALDHLDRMREMKSLATFRPDLDHAFALVAGVNSERVAAESNLHALSRTFGD